MSVIALMRCTGIKTYAGTFKNKSVIAGYVELDCVYSDDESMREFASATPSGSLKMTIDNPDALKQFDPRKYYKITIEETEA